MGATGLAANPKEYRERLDEQTDDQIDAWASELMRDIAIRRGVLQVIDDFLRAASIDERGFERVFAAGGGPPAVIGRDPARAAPRPRDHPVTRSCRHPVRERRTAAPADRLPRRELRGPRLRLTRPAPGVRHSPSASPASSVPVDPDRARDRGDRAHRRRRPRDGGPPRVGDARHPVRDRHDQRRGRRRAGRGREAVQADPGRPTPWRPAGDRRRWSPGRGLAAERQRRRARVAILGAGAGSPTTCPKGTPSLVAPIHARHPDAAPVRLARREWDDPRSDPRGDRGAARAGRPGPRRRAPRHRTRRAGGAVHAQPDARRSGPSCTPSWA